jgi:hypothetical protein
VRRSRPSWPSTQAWRRVGPRGSLQAASPRSRGPLRKRWRVWSRQWSL